MDVGGFRVPAPPLAPIDGMPEEKNKELADELRDMLGTSNDEEEVKLPLASKVDSADWSSQP
jgi:hypothetical protein